MKKRVLYMAILFALIVISYVFGYTKGLVAYETLNIPSYCSEYNGSCSKDDVTVISGAYIFLIPFIIGGIRIFKKYTKMEYFIFIVFWGIEGVFFFYGREIGKIILTVKYGNIVFIFWLILFILSFIFSTWYFMKDNIRNGEKESVKKKQ